MPVLIKVSEICPGARDIVLEELAEMVAIPNINEMLTNVLTVNYSRLVERIIQLEIENATLRRTGTSLTQESWDNLLSRVPTEFTPLTLPPPPAEPAWIPYVHDVQPVSRLPSKGSGWYVVTMSVNIITVCEWDAYRKSWGAINPGVINAFIDIRIKNFCQV